MKTLFTDVVDLVGRACPVFNDTKTYVNTGAVDKTIIIDDACETVCFEDKPSRANLSVESGSILFAKMKDTEKVLYIDDDLAENIYSTGFFAVKPKKEIIKEKSLYYLLLSDSFNSQKNKYSSGATQKAITNQGLKKIIINVPSLDEQNRLIATLDKLSVIILNYQQQLILLDKLIKSRFVEMFGDPQFNEKGFVKAPMGLYLTVLTDFSSNGSYKTLDNGVVMYEEPNYAWMVRTTDLETGDMSSVKFIDKEAYELLSKSKVYGGEIIMNKIGSAGKIYMMPKVEMPASLGRNAFLFRYDDRINTRFLYELLSSPYGEAEINQYVRGAVTKTITKDDVRSVMIIVPPRELQDAFAEFTSQVDKSKSVIQKSLDEAQLLFDSLMQEYFG